MASFVQIMAIFQGKRYLTHPWQKKMGSAGRKVKAFLNSPIYAFCRKKCARVQLLPLTRYRGVADPTADKSSALPPFFAFGENDALRASAALRTARARANILKVSRHRL